MKLQKLLLLLPLFALSFGFTGKADEFHYSLGKQAVAISENLFISKYEVSQLEYKQFLTDLGKDGNQAALLNCRPDSTVWFFDGKPDPYSTFYHQHPAFENYPVVGITHEAALAYCDWLTRNCNQQIKSKKGSHESAPQYLFRLPTEAEWLAAAGVGKPGAGMYPGGYTYPRDHKGRFVFNHKLGKGNFAGYAGGLAEDYEGYMITAPVTAFFADKHGMHNMAGNVAEMLAEKGLAKGGSWNHLPDDCRLESVQSYEKPASWLGFRVVIELVAAEDAETE